MENYPIARQGLAANSNMVLNPNVGYVAQMVLAIEKKNGYCPCSLLQTEDTVCPCKPMREKSICACQLFLPRTGEKEVEAMDS